MSHESSTVGEDANVDNPRLSGVKWRDVRERAVLTKTVDVSHVLRDDSLSPVRLRNQILDSNGIDSRTIDTHLRVRMSYGHVAFRISITSSCYVT
jgi:hypothetical protein